MNKLSTTKKIALAVLLGFLLIALFAPVLMPYAVSDFSFDPLLRPSAAHLLGTDEMGHDLFSLLVNGFRISILIAVVSGTCSTILGLLFAVLACTLPEPIGKLIHHIAGLFLIVPEVLVIIFFGVFAAPTLQNTVLAIVFFSWSKVFMLSATKIKNSFQKNKLLYTRLIGGNMLDVLRKLGPDLYPVVVVSFILQCNKAVTYETTLSFFGIGDPLQKSWGKLIKSALAYENLFYDDVLFFYLLPVLVCVFTFILALLLLSYTEEKQ